MTTATASTSTPRQGQSPGVSCSSRYGNAAIPEPILNAFSHWLLTRTTDNPLDGIVIYLEVVDSPAWSLRIGARLVAAVLTPGTREAQLVADMATHALPDTLTTCEHVNAHALIASACGVADAAVRGQAAAMTDDLSEHMNSAAAALVALTDAAATYCGLDTETLLRHMRAGTIS